MKKILIIGLSLAMALVISGCENMSKQQVGAVSGAALGGLVGSRFGRGTGQLVGVGLGAVAGALIGGQIGKTMDENDQLRAQRVLDKTPTRHTTTWTNPDNGNHYAVTPTKTYYSHNQPCREYITKATIAGKEQQIYGKACRQTDGSWKVIS